MKKIKLFEEFISESKGLELVHAYDKDGTMYGTGELIKKQGSKSLIRFDGETEKWFDSKDVKLVESNEIDEATTSWAKMMKGVKDGGSGPWSLIAIENNKVVSQKIDIKTKDILPAHFEALRKEYPKAKIHIEDAGGIVVWNEAFKQFLIESKEMFPNEIIGNDQILFKKEWEKMNGGKLAAKYNQYYKGYDIDFGGHIFNTVDQLEKYIKATELSNNQYQKYKYMPEIPIKESVVNEEEAYKVTKNTYRDYDSLNITQYDSIQFKQDGKKWIVRVVTCHDNVDKSALQKLGFGNSGDTRYGGISTFTKNANWHDLELNKKQFDELVKIVDAGWASHAKAFADFYKNRQAD